MRRSALLVLPLLIAAGLVAAQPAFAFSLVPEACQGTAELEECGLNQVVQVFINVAQFIFGISGSVALLMFIWGGFLWLSSAGNAEKVKQGQAVITGAVVGLIIIFGAYVGVQFIITALGVTSVPGARCGEGAEAGRSVETDSGLQCIPFGQCGRIGEGWEQVTITDANRESYTCEDGLLPDEAENVKCCHLNAGASPTGTGGGEATGTCHCNAEGSGLARDLGLLSADVIAQARSACTSVGGTFDESALECTGSSTEAECNEVRAALPSEISCDWTAGAGAPEGTSGRNNCVCADRGVTSVTTCGACLTYCTATRGSTMSEYLGAPLTSCP